MNRRGFLKGILASGVAPYVVTTAGVLMPVRKLLVPPVLYESWAERVAAPGVVYYTDFILSTEAIPAPIVMEDGWVRRSRRAVC
jgi:hypothetical protein